MKSAIPYHGGKYYCAKEIVKLANKFKHSRFVEGCFGGGAVTFEKQKEKGIIEIANDKDENLTNFCEVLANPVTFDQFKHIVMATPVSQRVYDKAIDYLKSGSDSVQLAVAYYVIARQSMAGRQDTFRPLTVNRTRGGVSAEANAWWNAIDRLNEIHERIKDIVIINEDILNVIKKYDSKDTLFYIDPPYLSDTRVSKKVYKYEMTHLDHATLLIALSNISGKFMLSGYKSDLYQTAERMYMWNKTILKVPNHSSSKSKKDIKNECIWTNY